MPAMCIPFRSAIVQASSASSLWRWRILAAIFFESFDGIVAGQNE